MRLFLSRIVWETRNNGGGEYRPESNCLPGDACPVNGCTGTMGVYDSRKKDGIRTRYLKCVKCDHKPEQNKLVTREPD